MGRSCRTRSASSQVVARGSIPTRLLRPRPCRARVQPGLQGPRDHPRKDRRLHPHMAKKRVHELAKQYDMPSAEVLKRLAAAGIEVKAAASAVDEDAADRALTGRPQKAEEQAEKAPQSSNGGQPEASTTRNGGGGDKPRQRPSRSSLQGERAPGAGGGVRRVVIDSQASRRQGGPGGGPPGPQRRPPRRGRRRRRGAYVEPVPQDKTTLQA